MTLDDLRNAQARRFEPVCGAYRVYRDAAELHRSLDELGVLP